MTNQKDIFSYLVPGKCAHLAGIGGVSMSPLAEVLHGMGLKVQGSDMNDGPSVEHLRSLGIPVAIEVVVVLPCVPEMQRAFL